ncbi:hypothetical protein GKE82_25170 [Conexibacter sp. W3-3-2]|uniref:copper resistance CopC family protein n=1 Tax=Conexibacter sp. W3-3-2 TaxID=2675227 RepID=UPI0012B7F6BF|nr:copper resistance protein CopC [Conexibacter sp. W3-3-2]MTD47498.1 hypothetical protein [Conexibacter sp. W3-3-2]
MTTRRRAALGTAAISAALLVPAAAIAHTEVQATFPAAGKTVRASQVGFVSVTFKSQIRAGTIKVTGPRGRTYQRGRAERDPGNSRRLRVRVSKLAKGSYTARWTMRHTDGHTLRGSFNFRVR